MSSTKSVSFSTIIMAVPERADRVASLLDKLELSDSHVVWDPNHEGHLPTWWRAIDKALAANPSHILILEDDALPAQDTLASVQKLIELYPDRIFSLYSNLLEIDEARNRGVSLVKTHRMLSDVAMVYPASWLRGLRKSYKKRAKELAGMGADEMRLKIHPDLVVWSTAPSLVDHGAPKESTLGHKYTRARARWVLSPYQSALEIDWTRV